MSIVHELLPALAAGMVAYVVARGATQTAIRVAEKRGIVDTPGERSSHAAPTPRVGGVGLVAGVVAVIAIYLPMSGRIQAMQGFLQIDPVMWKPFAGFLAMALAAFALGLIDDIKGMPALAKLAGQALVGCIPAATGLVVRQLQIPFLPVMDVPFAVGAAMAWLWVVVLMNAVNFMDGINGLAGRFGEMVGIVLVVLGINRGWCTEFAVVGAALWGASTGFLFWNRPVARTFLGDCGSQALGATAAAAMLLLHVNDLHRVDAAKRAILDPMAAGVILCAPFLFDVLWTLARRAAKGANVLEAHREHLYQRHLVATGGSHDRTLDFVMNRLYATGIATIVYVRLSDPSTPAFRAIIWAVVIGVLVHYAYAARKAEHRPSTAPPLPQ